jgi:hypothetical protein
MPLDDQVKLVFGDALTKLNSICTNINNVMAQNGLVQVTPIDNAKKKDILQKVYAEASNYDRHYSITRSALTSLLVTVGLAASKDGFDHMPSMSTLAISCDFKGYLGLSYELARTFFVTLILFFLAILINLYFQRMTFSCRLIEHKIEKLIQEMVAGVTAGTDRLRNHTAISGISGYEFRDHLGRVYREIPSPHFDMMARLLLTGIALFFSYLFTIASKQCNRPLIWDVAIVLGVPALVYLAAKLWNWLLEKVVGG